MTLMPSRWPSGLRRPASRSPRPRLPAPPPGSSSSALERGPTGLLADHGIPRPRHVPTRKLEVGSIIDRLHAHATGKHANQPTLLEADYLQGPPRYRPRGLGIARCTRP